MPSPGESKIIYAVGQALSDAGVPFEATPYSLQPRGARVAFSNLPGGKTLLVAYDPGIAPFQLAATIHHMRESTPPEEHLGLCVARMSRSLQEACKGQGVALFDLEGNAYLKLPGIYIERIRPTRAPTTQPTAKTAFTAKAARVVRALLKYHNIFLQQSRIVKETGLSAGYVSTLTKRLITQGYLADNFGQLRVIDSEQLLDDWLAHYRFDRHQKLSYAISARSYDEGIQKLQGALQEAGVHFAWTGWTGGMLRAPYATPSVYNAYVREAPKALQGVFPVEKQGNVSLYIPQDDGVFQYTTPSDFGDIVSDAQLYIDLSRIPGRGKEQADAVRHTRLNFAHGNTP